MNSYEYKNEELKLTCEYSLEEKRDIKEFHKEQVESLGDGGLERKIQELKMLFLKSESILFGIFNHHLNSYGQYQEQLEEADDEYALQKVIAREFLVNESFSTTLSFKEKTPVFVKMENLYFTLYSPLAETWELEEPNYEID